MFIVVLMRLHHCTDARCDLFKYCCRYNTQSVCVCLLVTAVSPTKMAEWIEMPFGDRDSAGDQGTMY